MPEKDFVGLFVKCENCQRVTTRESIVGDLKNDKNCLKKSITFKLIEI